MYFSHISYSVNKAGLVISLLQVKHVQQFSTLMKRIVLMLMSVPQMMTVNMIGYVVVMDVEDVFVLTLLKCAK